MELGFRSRKMEEEMVAEHWEQGAEQIRAARKAGKRARQGTLTQTAASDLFAAAGHTWACMTHNVRSC